MSAEKIPTLVGNYVTSTAGAGETLGAGANSANASTLVTSALAHGDEVAHIIAELRTFTETGDNWPDILQDYDDYIKKWTETNPLLAITPTPYKSNEWERITEQSLRGIASIRTASASSPVSDPLRAYIDEAVDIAGTTGTSDAKLEAMREIIEKTVWDAVSYQGSLMYLSYAQDETDGVCVTGTSQSPKTKAAWDVGAAMIIGDGYHSVLGRAQKRGVEFGTVGPAGISKAYEKIMKLLRDGQEEKTCKDSSNQHLHEIYEKIEAQMRIVYCQSILKYAYKIDKELLSNGSPKLDTVAEGQAMYRVIAGDIKAKEPTDAAVSGFFDSFFDINTLPTRKLLGLWQLLRSAQAGQGVRRHHLVARRRAL